MNFRIRSYKPEDYDQVVAMYMQSELYGGVFDEHRDSAERLRKRVEADPDSILVAEDDNIILGTVSLIEDGRVAWLYRFCVPVKLKDHDKLIPYDQKAVTQQLCDSALSALKAKGHSQVLVYTTTDSEPLHKRYYDLGFEKGSDYTCFWKDI